jgi:hypothetical protein
MTATVEILERPASRIEGFIDAVDGNRVFGWAWDRLNPGDHLVVELVRDGEVMATTTADQKRRDLQMGGIGDGSHAFEVTVEGDPATLTVVAASPTSSSRVALQNRGPVDSGAATAALLQRVAGAVEVLALGQRRLAGTLQQGPSPTVEQAMRELAEAQSGLKAQQAAMEVFLLRFETLMLQLAGQVAVLEDDKRRPAAWWQRLFNIREGDRQ